MATYNKRGYKPEKPETEKEEIEATLGGPSETAEFFGTLDSSANKVGTWFSRNQKNIFIAVGVLAFVAIGYAVYQNFIIEPREEEASNEMFQAQQYYDQAISGTASDSLYNLALNGGEGKLGFLKIAEEYSGTQTSKLAHYYAGISYLNTKKYKEAISHLEKYDSNDTYIKASALGAIGDAFAELGQIQDAYDYYIKASKESKDDYTTPRFAFKAGIAALELNKKEEAGKLFQDIKDHYKSSPQGLNIDFYLGLTQK